MLDWRCTTRGCSFEPKADPKPGIELNRFNRLRSGTGENSWLMAGETEPGVPRWIRVAGDGFSPCRASTRSLDSVEEPVLFGV